MKKEKEQDKINAFKAKINEIINEIGLCGDIKGTHKEYYDILSELLTHHPTDKANGMINLRIKQNLFRTLQLFVVYEEDVEDSISVNDCIKNKFSRYKKKINLRNDLIKALRSSISDQIIDFKSAFDYNFMCDLCGDCGSDSNKFHADHIKKFKTISDDFLLRYLEIPTEFDYIDGVPYLQEKDKNFEADWKKYHKEQAKLRILCRACNLKNK